MEKIGRRCSEIMSSKKKGFTLIELVVVIATAAVLVMILVPNLTAYAKKADEAKIQANMKNIHTAAEIVDKTEGNLTAEQVKLYSNVKDLEILDDFMEDTYTVDKDERTGQITIRYRSDKTGDHVFPNIDHNEDVIEDDHNKDVIEDVIEDDHNEDVIEDDEEDLNPEIESNGFINGGVAPLLVHEDNLEGSIVAGKHLSIGAPGNWGLLEGLTDIQVKKILSGDKSFQLPYSENNVYTTEPGNIKAFTVPGLEDRMKSVRNLPVDERKDAMTIIFPVVGGIINGRSDVTVKYYVSGLVKDVIVKHATGSEWALGDDFKRIKGPGKDYRNIISGLPNQAAGFIVVEFIEFIQLGELNVGDGI